MGVVHFPMLRNQHERGGKKCDGICLIGALLGGGGGGLLRLSAGRRGRRRKKGEEEEVWPVWILYSEGGKRGGERGEGAVGEHPLPGVREKGTPRKEGGKGWLASLILFRTNFVRGRGRVHHGKKKESPPDAPLSLLISPREGRSSEERRVASLSTSTYFGERTRRKKVRGGQRSVRGALSLHLQRLAITAKERRKQKEKGRSSLRFHRGPTKGGGKDLQQRKKKKMERPIISSFTSFPPPKKEGKGNKSKREKKGGGQVVRVAVRHF